MSQDRGEGDEEAQPLYAEILGGYIAHTCSALYGIFAYIRRTRILTSYSYTFVIPLLLLLMYVDVFNFLRGLLTTKFCLLKRIYPHTNNTLTDTYHTQIYELIFIHTQTRHAKNTHNT